VEAVSSNQTRWIGFIGQILWIGSKADFDMAQTFGFSPRRLSKAAPV
jgi:hypothetical protein